ncbi:MAG: adenylate/guanylate cyclase domain-containing protein [Acidimicrobiia bacterium]
MSQPASTAAEVVALNADVVGYSALLADDFDTITAAMGDIRKVVEDNVRGSGGTLVNFVGDNFMAVFPDSKDAMQSAIAITRAVEEYNVENRKDRQVRFRMGLDEGSVTVSGDQYFGDALNVAARIQAVAPVGGVSISGRVYRSLDEPALRFHSVGRKALKNIPEEVEVFQFTDLPTGGGAPSAAGGLSLAEPTVAVLPIHADSLEPGLQSGAGVIRDDLIHRLAQVPRLRVVNASVGPGAHSLGETVRYLLETGVHQVGDQVRVYARLVDVTSMNIVTTNRWTASTADLLALSDDVAEETARAIEIELIIGEPAGLYADLEDPAAIQNIYTGWYHLTAGTPEGLTKAIEYFGRVAVSHPDLTYGHVLSAFAYWMWASMVLGTERGTYLEKALEGARVAEKLGDHTGLAQMVIAGALMFQGKSEQALEKINNLEIRRPTCDVTYAVEGSVRRYMGDWEKSVDLLDKAMRLTAANNPWYPTVQACSFFLGGRIEQAASTAEAVIEHQPSNLEALLVLIAAQVEMGMERRARATAELVRERFPAVDVDRWLTENPYQKREMVERWKADLATAGVFD